MTTIHPDELKADENYIFLTTLLITELQLQCMESLKGSHFYKQRLRNGCNIVASELRQILQYEMDAVASLNNTDQFTIADYIEQMMAECVTMRPEYFGAVVDMIRKMKDSPTEVMEFLNLQLTTKAA